MKQTVYAVCLLLVVLSGAFVASRVFADQEYLPQGASANASRPCDFESQTTQTVTVTGTSAATTNATGKGVVRVVCTAAAHMLMAAAPTALTSSAYIPANTPEYFLTKGTKFAFIQNAAGGTCFVSECK